MNHQKGRYDKYNTDREFRKIDDTYVFDSASGIYKPKTNETQQGAERQDHRLIYEPPIRTHTDRDWISLAISVLTLLVIGWYTYVTQGIYRTSEVEAIGTIEGSMAARDAADAATKAASTAMQSLQLDQRAWVGPIEAGPPLYEENGKRFSLRSGKRPSLILSLSIRERRPRSNIE